MSSEKLLPWAKPLLISSTLTQATIYVLRPMITYRALELDANAAQIGLIASVYALFPVVLALHFGKWVGRMGEAKFIIYGTLAMLVTSAALMFADSITLLALAAGAAGLAHLACMVGGQSMVALRAPRESYDRYFGFYTFSASVGHMLGPIVAAIVAGSNGNLPKSTSNAFLLGVVLTILALFPVIRWRNERPTVVAQQSSEGTYKTAINLVKRPGILAAIYISLAISSVADVLVVFLPLFGTENNFSPFAVGVILAIRAGTSMFSRIFLGAIAQKLGSHFLMVSSIVASTVFCGAMFFARTPLTLAIAVGIAGLALGVGQPLTMSLVSRLAPPEDRALAISARLTANRVGQFVVPASAGAIAGAAGAGSIFLGLAALLASSIFTAL